jgi:hypothetical protein
MNKKRTLIESGTIWTTFLIVGIVQIFKITIGHVWGKFLRWKWPMRDKNEN